MPDIVITLNCKEWNPDFDEWEKNTDWDPWVLTTRLPEIYEHNKVYVCHCDEVKGYMTIERIEFNTDFPQDATEVRIYCDRFFKLETPVSHKCRRGWERW